MAGSGLQAVLDLEPVRTVLASRPEGLSLQRPARQGRTLRRAHRRWARAGHHPSGRCRTRSHPRAIWPAKGRSERPLGRAAQRPQRRQPQACDHRFLDRAGGYVVG